MRITTAALLLLLGRSAVANADSMTCGGRLVSVGDTTGDVTIKCGSPTAVDRRKETNADGSTHVIETWTYNLGPNDFIRNLTFKDGTLKKIVAGGYGK